MMLFWLKERSDAELHSDIECFLMIYGKKAASASWSLCKTLSDYLTRLFWERDCDEHLEMK